MNHKLSKLPTVLLIITCLSLVACFSPEYSNAKDNYELALKTKDLPLLVTSLKKLAELEPKEFKAKYNKAHKQLKNLNQAKVSLEQHKYHLAYVNARNVYRGFSTNESKKILIESGSKFLTLLEINKYLEQAAIEDILDKSDDIEEIFATEIIEWDVIKVNALLMQLTKGIELTKAALAKLDEANIVDQIPEMKQWSAALNHQLAYIESIQLKLIDHASYKSSMVLLAINNELTKESIRLLSLIRPSLAFESMKPIFNKAISDYELYRYVMENIAFATTTLEGDVHADWYNDWLSIENAILNPHKRFATYPAEAKNRISALTKYKTQYEYSLKQAAESLEQINTINSKNHSQVTNLIANLSKDKNLLYIGLATKK